MWHFKPVERGIPERNPRETEFFKITSPAEAVVREFIQNALDARRNQEIIKVKISFCCKRRNTITSFLDDTLKQHLVACQFLDYWGYPDNISCLILEDFGTTGLDGPPAPDAGNGNFYNFWWREGISEKMGQRAGRWGLGKTTFHLVSKIRTFWGLTTRNDGKALLMGKALLKTHTLNNERYHYFGYFSDENFMPLEDSSVVSLFKENFKINRNNTETGLSIVIPMPVDETGFNAVLKGAIQHYFYPVLTGILKIEIHEDNRTEELNADNLVERASTLEWDNTEWEGMNIREILEFVKITINQDSVSLQIKDPGSPEITSGSFGDQLHERKASFRSGAPLKFQFPVKIKKNDGSEQDSFLTVLLKRFPDLKTPFECYIRSGVTLSEIRMLGKRPVASLLVAEDEPVCEFLGDCETPAHTNWNERTEGFTEKYENAVRILRFIKKSANQIISILDEPPHERQVDFLKEIFSVPIVPEEREEKEKGITEKGGGPKLGNGTPEVFNVSMIQKGFSVTLNPQKTNIQLPFNATIKLAYDIRRGNPFAQYEKFDFDVGSGSMNITCQDCNILSRDKNEIKIKVTGQNFRIEVTGFDPTRDIVVYVKEGEKS